MIVSEVMPGFCFSDFLVITVATEQTDGFKRFYDSAIKNDIQVEVTNIMIFQVEFLFILNPYINLQKVNFDYMALKLQYVNIG